MHADARVQPIGAHGLIGDRRTAALVAHDGNLVWCCLPDFNGDPVFGALLDAGKGGHWRLGPASGAPGEQAYLDASAVLCTTWREPLGTLELLDCMPWPERAEDAPGAARRVILRRLRCTAGRVECVHDCAPRRMFGPAVPLASGPAPPHGGPSPWIGWWSSDPRLLAADGQTRPTRFALHQGQVLWLVAAWCEPAFSWSEEEAERALRETQQAWESWSRRHPFLGPQREAVLGSLRAIRLLTYEPRGNQVAAPTTSLPEKIGASRNDYRYAWVRDSSLALAILAVFGDLEAARRYMDWLAGLGSATEMPLQVLYGIDGSCDATERTVEGIAGHAGSRPVRIGNRAAGQLQMDSLGYLADCALIYLQQGGSWSDAYSDLVHRIAAFTAAHWRRADNGIWELEARRHYVSSKAMAWVVLDRATKVFRHVGREPDPSWAREAQAIHAELMERGWNESRRAFRQHYATEELDASTLLIGTMDLLPGDDPRLADNVAAIGRELQREGFIWRFHPRSLGHGDLPLDGLEGAFLPCTFWYAAALARLGQSAESRAILERVEAAFGARHLYPEEYDPWAGIALGNHPLLFSHAEHLKAVMDLAMSQPLRAAEMMVGKMAGKALRALGGRWSGSERKTG